MKRALAFVAGAVVAIACASPAPPPPAPPPPPPAVPIVEAPPVASSVAAPVVSSAPPAAPTLAPALSREDREKRADELLAGGNAARSANDDGGGTWAIAQDRTDGRSETPRGDARIETVTATVPVANAHRVVAGTRPRFRMCYRKGLLIDPSLQGRLRIVVKLAPSGEVKSAAVDTNTGLSDQVARCSAAALNRGGFDAPGGNGSTLLVSVRFVRDAP